METTNPNHDFSLEVQTCRQMFKNDTVAYLKKVDKLYREEYSEIRARYTAVAKDESLCRCARQKILSEIVVEHDLISRLINVIGELIFDRKRVTGRCIQYMYGRKADVNDNYRTLVLHKVISNIRKNNPGMTEDEALTRYRDTYGQTT